MSQQQINMQQEQVQAQAQAQGQVPQGQVPQGQVPQGQVQAQVQFNYELEEKKMLSDREYINKAIQMAIANKFTGEHYVLWRELISGILITAELWGLFDVDARYEMGRTCSEKYNMTKAANARLVLLSGLSKEIASQYTAIQDPAELLATLDTVYNSNTATTRSEIRKTFQQLQLDDFKTVSEYIEKLKYTVQKMISMGVPVSDEEKIHQLYAGLSEEFGPTISYLRIANIRDFDTIVSTIRDCGVEWEKKQKQIANNDQAHYTGNNKVGGNRNYNKNNNNMNNNYNNNNNNNKNAFPFRCYRCNQVGHRISECTKPKPTLNPEACIHCKRNNHKSEACYFKNKTNPYPKHIANLVSETVQAVLTKLNINQAHSVIEQPTNKVPQQNTTTNKPWTAMLDSAASRHYIKDVSLIENMYPLSSPLPVAVANNEIVELNQGGQITIDTSTTPIQLDVTYAPTFKENLISIGQLATENNAVTILDGDTATVTFGSNNGKIVANKKGNMYLVEQNEILKENKNNKIINTNKNINNNYVYTTTQMEIEPLKLLHQRMGHVSVESLMKVKEAVIGIENINIKTKIETSECQGCALGKSHRNKFSSHTNEPAPTDNMDMVVADLCGPIYGKYISTIIPVKPRTVFIEIINKKSEAVNHIMKWNTYATTLTGKVLKRFHSDGGGEYISNKLKSYFEKQGTIMTTTTRNTPQHNGIVERMNRTILEMARSMIHHGQLHKSYWMDAVKTAVYIINRCVPSSLTSEGITRYEAWTGIKPSIEHLRVFGCDVYRHIQKDQRQDKISATSSIGVFIGYDEEKNGYYKIWDTKERKVYRTRDVDFNEYSFTQGKIKKFSLWSNSEKEDELLIYQYDMDDSNSEKGNRNNIYKLLYKNPTQDDVQQQLLQIPETEIKQPENIENHDNNNINIQEEVKVERKYEPQVDHDLNNDNDIKDDESDEEEVVVNELRRSTRVSQPVKSDFPMINMDNYSSHEIERGLMTEQINNTNTHIIPTNYNEAMSSTLKEKWIQAQDEEMKSLQENNTWTYTTLPPGKHAIDCMWVYAVKLDELGNVTRYKARLVAKGYLQQAGIDYHETFAAVMKYKSLRIILMLAACRDYELVQLDVVTAFLNANIDEEVYMKQPRGYERGDNLYCKLDKALYGLRQASHNWNELLNDFITVSLGFTRLTSDSCIYIKKSKTGELIIIATFVDDMPAAYHKQDEQEWLEIKQLFMSRFKMKDMGECKLILGMRIKRDRSNKILTIDNEIHIKKLLETYGMKQCKPCETPEAQIKLIPTTEQEQGQVDRTLYQSMIGALNYLVQTCRPDIAHAVNVVCRYSTNPSPIHLIAVKRILRYLSTTSHIGLTYNGNDMYDNNNITITAYTDADWGGDHVDRKSTTGYLTKINGCTISWATKKQQTVALSTAEAEYMGIAAGVQEAIWIKQFLSEMISLQNKEINIIPVLYCDNQAAISISHNDIHHHRTKHIDIRHHFIRDHVKQNNIQLKWIPTQEQLADGLTKPLEKIKFKKLTHEIMNNTNINIQQQQGQE